MICHESHMPKAPAFTPRWAEVPSSWPADLGGIHYITALLLLRSRKEHQLFIPLSLQLMPSTMMAGDGEILYKQGAGGCWRKCDLLSFSITRSTWVGLAAW